MLPSKPTRGIIVFLFILTAVPSVFGQSLTNKIFAARAEKEFLLRQAAFAANPDEPTNCWQFARSCYDWADCATNDTQRENIADQGIAAAKHLIAQHSKAVAAHYYLGMNYGQRAEAIEPALEALHLVNEIEKEFKTCEELDPHFDYAGPARNLGLLYRDAPGWPLSIGNNQKAKEHLVQATTLNPEYPENQLNLAESQLHWHDYDDAAKTLKKLAEIWPAAKTNFTGEAWEPSWSDWIPRRAAAEAALQKYHPSAAP